MTARTGNASILVGDTATGTACLNTKTGKLANEKAPTSPAEPDGSISVDAASRPPVSPPGAASRCPADRFLIPMLRAMSEPPTIGGSRLRRTDPRLRSGGSETAIDQL